MAKKNILTHAKKRKAMTLLQANRWHEAKPIFADICRLDRRDSEAWFLLGGVNGQLALWEEATQCWREAIAIRPGYTEAHYNLGQALIIQAQYTEAVDSFRQALQLKPDYAEACNGMAFAMNKQGRLEDALREFLEALRHKPDFTDAHSNLVLYMHYSSAYDSETLYAEHLRWAQAQVGSITPFSAHKNTPEPHRRLRIGYVSPDLYSHSVASFFEPLLSHHNPEVVETLCYSDVEKPDAITARLKSMAGGWREVQGLPHEHLAAQIRADGVDILVDLAGHTACHRLLTFARKPAPVQVTYLGYPNTTGLSTIDYRFTDAYADPPGESDRWHTETLIRLPQGFLCYQPPAFAPPVTSLPARVAGHITFGSFNNLAKIRPDVIGLWAKILQALPDARLMIKNKSLHDAQTRERIHELFAAAGVPQERVELHHEIPVVVDHLAKYGKVDIALDTFPYNGATTTCEALWMGVPVITFTGNTHAGRMGVSLLMQVGMGEFVARNPEDYVRLAAHWAHNLDALEQLRAGLRKRMAGSSLCDGKAFVRQVEHAYRDMWAKWCSNRYHQTR